MARFKVPPAHELPKIIGGNLPTTVTNYRQYLLRGAGRFSYEPSRVAAPHAIRQSLGLSSLLRQCYLTRPPEGREPNAEVIRTLWQLGNDKSWVCHTPPNWVLDFRSDLGVSIRADLLIVENGRPYLFWMQMRRGKDAPDQGHLLLLGRLFMIQAALAGLSDVGLLIADMRKSEDGKRDLILTSVADMALPSEEYAARKLQLFADAHDQLVRENFDPKFERLARRQYRGDGPQQDFFR